MIRRHAFRLLQRPSHAIQSTSLKQIRYRLPDIHGQVRHLPYYQRGNYQRFQQGAGILGRWVASRTFYYQVAGIAGVIGGFYVYNLEEVPVSGRRRFNVISVEEEAELSKQMYAEVMQQFRGKILPARDRRTIAVRRVIERLIPSSGMQDLNWEVHVIDDPQLNAFVIPGGKVFVFSGILPICNGDDGLAAVLGHEIAHVVAHHSAERMSQALVFVKPLIFVLNIFFWGNIVPILLGNVMLDLGFAKPGSRKQETEADYIGLMMMAQSCYNPDAAVGLWARMERAAQGEPPQFLSTHPSNHNRQEKIREWLPEAHEKRAMSDCSSTLGYAQEFHRVFRQPVW